MPADRKRGPATARRPHAPHGVIGILPGEFGKQIVLFAEGSDRYQVQELDRDAPERQGRLAYQLLAPGWTPGELRVIALFYDRDEAEAVAESLNLFLQP